MSATPARRGQAGAPQEDAHETAVLTIDLDALVANYRLLRDRAKPAECAAVVKADAYGLGMDQAAPALWRAGCRTFFVATVGEALELRDLLPEAIVYAFNGLLEGTAEIFHERRLRPVLNSAAEIAEWSGYCACVGEMLPCGLHIDTGMNRLGLSAAEVETVSRATDIWSSLTLSLVMSHLACADDHTHPKNRIQQQRFEALRGQLPKALTSLANSAGILLGTDYFYDLVRPGIALYGGHPQRHGENPFHTVVHLEGRILQVREGVTGETVGYGATRKLHRPSRIAIVSVGYADGLFRALSAEDEEDGFVAYLGPYPAPILGRVSMDLIAVDVTDAPAEAARRGAWIELLGPNVSAHKFALHAGTIDYEVLTSLGRRATRRYLGG